jgi:hypothetical protein
MMVKKKAPLRERARFFPRDTKSAMQFPASIVTVIMQKYNSFSQKSQGFVILLRFNQIYCTKLLPLVPKTSV